MNRTKTMMLLMARWLVVLAASLVVSSSTVFASAPAKAKSTCNASCSKRCPCCLSKSTPANSSAPLAPSPSPRTAVAKDFQLVPLLTVLLAPQRKVASPAPSQFFAAHFSPAVPVFVSHCAFLI